MELKVSEMTPAQLLEVQRRTDDDKAQDFSFTLNKVTDVDVQERLRTMIDDITIQGKKLADHMDIKDMKKYRAMIKEFINEVVTNSHKFSRENFLDRRGRHRVYGIIKLVDKNIDDLAQELLKKEKDHIKILDLTGEIHGLLLDIAV